MTRYLNWSCYVAWSSLQQHHFCLWQELQTLKDSMHEAADENAHRGKMNDKGKWLVVYFEVQAPS